MNTEKKYLDISWDFRTANVKEYTHCYHNYPAMMIPQIANRLINLYGKKAKTLFDPYCGTGTSLVEATLNGINAIGTDLNPMARLIAEAKTTIMELQILDLYLKEFNDFLFSLNFGIKTVNVVVPDFKNIEFWFKDETKEKLAIIKNFIDNTKDERVKKFFLVAFSETVRESSLTRNSEFKLYRMPEKQRDKFKPDVFGIISSKLARNRIGLKEYIEKRKDTKTIIYDFNSCEDIEKIEKDSIDIVVTSPPYGDSRTTVAYGQFSRLSNQWLGIENASQIDNQLMGGKAKNISKVGINIIDATVEKVAEQDEKRAKEVYSFYDDYSKSIANVSKVIKKNGYACYVVGNRRVKDTTLPTDEITKSLFQEYGFKYKNTFIRNIPNKRMPSKNSPTNVMGKKATTMNNEYIVIMQKQ
ncbi:MAG: DNA methyltransferase [Desulfobacterales bacterium]|nr:DNA methyltransferase [Desulfobacterales bacterium]